MLKNPIVKICAMVVIIYFALFANTENPDSLGNRLSPEKIKENYKAAKKQSAFIIQNVTAAQEHQRSPKKIIDYNTKEIACGDMVFITYSIYQGQEKIHTINNAKFVIGIKDNWAIEKKIIGLKKGDETSLPISDPSAKGKQFIYKITINKVARNPYNTKTDCT